MRFEAEAVTRVSIEVRNPEAVERVTGPGGDEWRSRFYGLRTADEVVAHWAYNAVFNGVTDVRRLDGWADLAEDDVVVQVGPPSPWLTRRVP